MRCTALIVEDHPEQADLLARLLRLKLHTDPILAEDGETGLQLARERQPDVMLLDLMLPDINGFDVCRRLRSDPATMLIPVVIVTALSRAQDRDHGFRVGANDFVLKPYGVEVLFEAITAARAWRARMELEPREGEIEVRLGGEIPLFQGLNDLLVHLRCSTPYSAEQALQYREAVHKMAQLATEWGLRENVVHPLQITYQLDLRTFTLTARGQARGPDLAPTPHTPQPEADGSKKERPTTMILPCPTCQRPLRVPRDRGELVLICPICRTRWDWSPPISTFGDIYRRLTEDGLVDEVRYDEAGHVVHLTKSFASQGEVAVSV